MTNCPPGLQRIKQQVTVAAPVEVCYQAWLDSTKMPSFMKRLIRVEQRMSPAKILTAPAEIEANATFLERSRLPLSTIKHWLFSGPGGKLYEVENTVVLEIPNHFYCTTSTDPRDLSVQSSVFFCPDSKNHHTFIEWEISFWTVQEIGSMTRLACDILETGDTLLEDSLSDFKAHIEANHQKQRHPAT